MANYTNHPPIDRRGKAAMEMWTQIAQELGYADRKTMLHGLHWDEGLTIRQMADKIGYVYSWVLRVMKRDGVPVKPWGGARVKGSNC